MAFFGGASGRARTYDPLIKSQLLYQLSYRGGVRKYVAAPGGFWQGPMKKRVRCRSRRTGPALCRRRAQLPGGSPASVGGPNCTGKSMSMSISSLVALLPVFGSSSKW